MTILTRFSAKDFRELLQLYSIGSYRSHKHIPYALGNTNYALRTTEGEFIVKVFENSNMRCAAFMLKIEEYLHKRGIRVPRVVLSGNGKDLLTLKGKPVALYAFIKGRHTKRLTEGLTMGLARNIGLMHRELRKLRFKGRGDWMPANRIVSHMRSKHSNSFVEGEYSGLRRELKSIRYSRLKKSIIHGDLGYINFIVEKDRLKAFIDFDDVHRDFLVHDLAVLFAHTFMSYKRIKRDRIRLFMRHYQKIIRLNDEEKRAMLTFIKVRLISVMIWHEMQKAKHTDQIRKIREAISNTQQQYRMLSRISPERFAGMLE
ncbi:MAG: phosphotransferase [Candidatus Woesearchaeota archaeon]